MDYFENLAKKETIDNEILPDWVNLGNASYRAWKATQELQRDRLKYIGKHTKPSDYKIKSKYLIYGAEVAEVAKIARATLTSTSTYSKGFSEYLGEINKELEAAKEQRLSKTSVSKSRGPIARTKDDLVSEVTTLRKQINELKQKNAREQVEHTLRLLDPEVRSTLMLSDMSISGSKLKH